jgi:myotubularin-related protein 5/13
VSTSESATTSAEQEKYLGAVVQATPLSVLRQASSAWGMSESSLSIDSLLLTAEVDHQGTTPEQARRITNPFTKAVVGTLG